MIWVIIIANGFIPFEIKMNALNLMEGCFVFKGGSWIA